MDCATLWLPIVLTTAPRVLHPKGWNRDLASTPPVWEGGEVDVAWQKTQACPIGHRFCSLPKSRMRPRPQPRRSSWFPATRAGERGGRLLSCSKSERRGVRRSFFCRDLNAKRQTTIRQSHMRGIFSGAAIIRVVTHTTFDCSLDLSLVVRCDPTHSFSALTSPPASHLNQISYRAGGLASPAAYPRSCLARRRSSIRPKKPIRDRLADAPKDIATGCPHLESRRYRPGRQDRSPTRSSSRDAAR
jgi:hypothetical protein